ncbi:triose-phosphate isomerase [Wenyingzhuangia fucanilytica]|uniref:Triosephosphate isomerase n=1 Tax=Wenyingzhuangia fucanilytica TaxID=1790137 RepID=A0A1B1Y4B7_9FLAO|nr:triose-phosphate isomerase [Wenyingzhuangia fucanilytica]ANW95589.1 triose-phosphate isomerase [Wenyingzhuangia fucanilytica]
MRSKIVAGNWKMNNNVAESKALAEGLVSELKGVSLENTRVIVSPTFVNLTTVLAATEGSAVEVAAQNMHQETNGAYTGEVSADMLTSTGIKTVILGHSERREYFGEDEALLAKKTDAALAKGLEVIYCFGEVKEEREANTQEEVVAKQISGALFHLDAAAWSNIVLAYEPVWAIGTGLTASADQAQEMHAFIRGFVADKYGAEVAENVSILYGGSCKPSNAVEIFSKPDVDGGLIGGASLVAADFAAVVKAI